MQDLFIALYFVSFICQVVESVSFMLFTDFLAGYIEVIPRRLKLNCRYMKFNMPDGR